MSDVREERLWQIRELLDLGGGRPWKVPLQYFSAISVILLSDGNGYLAFFASEAVASTFRTMLTFCDFELLPGGVYDS